MSCCFLCGEITDARVDKLGFKTLDNAIGRIMSEYNIHKVYSCNRNLFDDICNDAIRLKCDKLNIGIYWVTASSLKAENDETFNCIIYPFQKISDEDRQLSLYKWMTDKSQYMLTYIDGNTQFNEPFKSIYEYVKARDVEIINLNDLLPKA